jgi:hypothetical protein
MAGALARKLFGSSNERRIKSYLPRVAEINALEGELEKLSDDELRARTEAFKKQVADGTSLDDILVEAFATCREAAKRTLGQRHFDVQLIGGMILHEGCISEMKTGEGKTLVATLPVYLNALSGRPRRRAAQEGLRLRRHLRHQQRARLRLSARQHEVSAGGHGPARAHLCDRRRGRLDPDR